MTVKQTIKQIEQANQLFYELRLNKKHIIIWVEIDKYPYRISTLKDLNKLLKENYLEEHKEAILNHEFKQDEEIELITTWFDGETTKDTIKFNIY